MQPLHGWAVNLGESASVTFTFIKKQIYTEIAFTTNTCKTAPGQASKHIKGAYPDTFGEVVEYSGFESERFPTNNRVREGEAHKEGLESSEISLKGHSKPDTGCAESPCCPFSNGVWDSLCNIHRSGYPGQWKKKKKQHLLKKYFFLHN